MFIGEHAKCLYSSQIVVKLEFSNFLKKNIQNIKFNEKFVLWYSICSMWKNRSRDGQKERPTDLTNLYSLFPILLPPLRHYSIHEFSDDFILLFKSSCFCSLFTFQYSERNKISISLDLSLETESWSVYSLFYLMLKPDTDGESWC
jgi:hypothetical protein